MGRKKEEETNSVDPCCKNYEKIPVWILDTTDPPQQLLSWAMSGISLDSNGGTHHKYSSTRGLGLRLLRAWALRVRGED